MILLLQAKEEPMIDELNKKIDEKEKKINDLKKKLADQVIISIFQIINLYCKEVSKSPRLKNAPVNDKNIEKDKDKDKEVAYWKAQFAAASVKTEKNEKAENLKKASAQVDLKKIVDLENENIKLKNDLKTIEVFCDEARSQNEKNKGQITILNNQLKDAKNMTDSNNQSEVIQSFRAQITSLNALNQSLNNSYQDAKLHNDKTGGEVQNLRNLTDQVRQQNSTLITQNHDLKLQFDKINAETSALKQLLEREREQNEKLTTQNYELKIQCDKNNAEILTLKQLLGQQREQIIKFTQNYELKTQYDAEIQNLKSQLEASKSDNEKANSQNCQFRIQIQDSKLENEKLKIQQFSLADEYKAKYEKADTRVHQLEEDKTQLEHLIERLKQETIDLNTRVQNLCEENGKINDLAIKRLKEVQSLKLKSEEFERSHSNSIISQVEEA